MDSVFPPVLRAAPWLLLGGVALLALGFWGSSLIDAMPSHRAQELLWLALIGLLMAALLVAWQRWRLANALVIVGLGAHVAMVGPMPLAATALLVCAALALGERLTRGTRAGPVLALLVGLALIAAVVGWLLPLRVHRDWVYALGLAAIIAGNRGALLRQSCVLRKGWRRAVTAAPRMAALGVLALGLAATPGWLPTLQFDDLAYHLGIPAQLQALGFYRMDPASQVWALAPWGSDVIQAIVQVMVGAEARGSVNLVWLLTSAWLVASLCRAVGLAPPMAWLAVLLYASLPMTAMLMGGMQTEGPGTTYVLALAWLIQRSGSGAHGPTLRVAALLAGFMLALKASFGLPALLLGAWLLWQWRGRVPWQALPTALALGVLVGGSSYTFAWALAGNPLLPLFNAVFASPYFAEANFLDPRFTGQFGADILWRLVFETDRMLEGWRGAGGFQMIGLALVLPLALAARSTRPLAMVSMGMVMFMLLMVQYLRYAHPAMVLMLVPMLAGLAAVRAQRLAIAAGMLLATLNFTYQANVNWTLRFGGLKMLVSRGGEPDNVVSAFAPERLLLHNLGRHERVLVAGRPFHAELAGRGFVLSWYDPELLAKARSLTDRADEARLRGFLHEHGFTHVLIGGQPVIPDLGNRLSAMGARRLQAINDAVLWQLPEGPPEQRRDLMRERDLATRMRRAWR